MTASHITSGSLGTGAAAAGSLAPPIAGDAIGLYLIGWAIFTFYMTIAALKTNVAVLWVFITLTATCVLLVLAEVTNATFGRDLIPAWPLT